MSFPALTALTKELFAVPPYAQRIPNICSMVNFFPEAKRLMNQIPVRRIVEIGSEAGLNTAVLLEYAKQRSAGLITVDPAEVPFPFDAQKESSFVFYRELSKDYLKRGEPSDVIFMDGDHNYETVLSDLRSIHQMRRRIGIKLLFLHDVSWPWARRDIYYDPARLETPHPFHAENKASPYEGENTPGLKPTGYQTADTEGGPANGVLTAVEDFLRESSGKWLFWRIPVLYGIGILVCLENLKKDVLRSLTHSLEELSSHKELLSILELNRVENLCQLNSLEAVVHDAGDIWRNDQAYIQKVNLMLPEVEEQRQRLTVELAECKRISAEQEQQLSMCRVKIPELERQVTEQANSLARVSAESEDYKQTSERLSLQLAESHSYITGLQQNLSETKTHLAESDTRLQSSENVCAEQQKQLSEITMCLQTSENTCAEQQKQLSETAVRLQTSENTCAEQQKQLSETAARLQTSENTCAEQQKQLSETAARLQTSENTCAEQQKQIIISRTQMTVLDQKLQETEKHLARITDSLRESEKIRQTQKEALELRISEQTGRADGLSAALQGKEKLCTEQAGQVADCKQRIQELNRQLSEKEGQVVTISAERTELQKTCGEREKQLTECHVQIWNRDQELRKRFLELPAERWRVRDSIFRACCRYGIRNRKRLAEVRKILLSGDCRLFSLDIFDTLLLRELHSESKRFQAVASILHRTHPEWTEEQIYTARSLAHWMAYQSCSVRGGCREADAVSIFRIMVKILGWEESSVSELMQAELLYEQKHLHLNPVVWDLVTLAQTKNIPVIAVSDMYWSGKALQQILEKILPDVSVIRNVYSSCDSGVSKQSSLLFEKVWKENGVEPSAMLHIGDNYQADFAVPFVRYGIPSFWLPRSKVYTAFCRKQQQSKLTSLYERNIIHGVR